METLPSRYKRALARVGKYGKGEVRREGGGRELGNRRWGRIDLHAASAKTYIRRFRVNRRFRISLLTSLKQTKFWFLNIWINLNEVNYLLLLSSSHLISSFLSNSPRKIQKKKRLKNVLFFFSRLNMQKIFFPNLLVRTGFICTIMLSASRTLADKAKRFCFINKQESVIRRFSRLHNFSF